jgi:hypothetical protein
MRSGGAACTNQTYTARSFGCEPPHRVCAPDSQEHTPAQSVDEQQEARHTREAHVVVPLVWCHRRQRQASVALPIPQATREKRLSSSQDQIICKDYELLLQSSESWIYACMIRIMTRCLARAGP